MNTYDQLAAGLKRDFRAGLNVGTLMLRAVPLIRDKTIDQWMNELSENFKQNVKEQLTSENNRVVAQIEAEVAAILEFVDSEIRARKGSSVKGDEFAGFPKDSTPISGVSSACTIETPVGAIPPALQTTTGLGLAGVLLMATTHVAILDITGGILTAAAAALAAGVLIFKRGSIINEFETRIENSRKCAGGMFAPDCAEVSARFPGNLFGFVRACRAAQTRISKAASTGCTGPFLVGSHGGALVYVAVETLQQGHHYFPALSRRTSDVIRATSEHIQSRRRNNGVARAADLKSDRPVWVVIYRPFRPDFFAHYIVAGVETARAGTPVQRVINRKHIPKEAYEQAS